MASVGGNDQKAVIITGGSQGIGAGLVDAYRRRGWQELLRLGHLPGTVKTHMVLAGQLNRWLCAEGFSISHLTPSVAEAFLITRRARDQRRVPTLAVLPVLGRDPRDRPGQRHACGRDMAGTRPPPTMSAAEVDSLLASCDRSTKSGRRDYAILTLLAQLAPILQ
jgi:hypothetical protein